MTPEQMSAWLEARCGKLTASRMGDAMDFNKNGQPSQKRSDLIRDILAERYTQSSVRHYVNDAMQWGIEKEAEAKAAWEAHSGLLVNECGLYDHPTIDMFAATPDGLIGADGLIETKCPTTPKFVRWVMNGVVPEEHRPQMAAQLLCTGRKWVEFVAYDPRVRDPSRRLFVRRFKPEPEYLQKVEKAAVDFLAEVDELWEQLIERAA